MRKFRCSGALFSLLLAVVPAPAHHSTAMYDLVHGTIIEGVVKRFDFENPHAHIALDVTGENNEIEHWSVELESAGMLHRLGWDRNTVKAGDHITVTGGRAKDNSFSIRALWVQLPDGRKMRGLPIVQP